MTQKDKFIEKHYEEILAHYRREAKDLGYMKDQLDEYAQDALQYTFIGTQKQLNEEFKSPESYIVICREGRYLAVETFDGTFYHFFN